MSIYTENNITYVTFRVKSSLFAVPINETVGIMKMTQEVPHTILPGAPNYVKYIVEVEGLIIPVVNLQETDGDMGTSEDLIVVLDFEQRIGISADEVHFVTISANEIIRNPLTEIRTFMCGGKNYSILDDCQLHKYLSM